MSRIVLCVVDQSDELKAAVHYACLYARKHGYDVGLFHSMEMLDIPHWSTVETMMRQENRAEAEEMLRKWAVVVEGLTGERPVTFVREGGLKEQLFSLLQEEPDIVLLVLAAAHDAENPGPLVSALAGRSAGTLPIPLMIVPGRLSAKDIEALA
jgi:hypothetical protein